MVSTQVPSLLNQHHRRNFLPLSSFRPPIELHPHAVFFCSPSPLYCQLCPKSLTCGIFSKLTVLSTNLSQMAGRIYHLVDYFLITFVSVCACASMHVCIYVEVRGQFAVISSPLPSCQFPESCSGCCVCQQAPLLLPASTHYWIISSALQK